MSPQSETGESEPISKRPEEIVRDWWRECIAAGAAPAGPRAELRRARTLDEVVFVPLFHDLRRRLAWTTWTRVDRLALVAGILSRVAADDVSVAFPSQMTKPRPGSASPRVAPARFRRLLRIGDEPGDATHLFELMRRVISLLDGNANVADLAISLYWWNARTRRNWALAYYEKVNERPAGQ
ncbi:MAG TPA: type I-E CRISPR-associated protein Cse2/CasB [Thermoanaerobaculales bacterium]|nr:type I-E CRISPR-associated protein Cse2/CasB [Thermoanaerobaculales bacterium]